MRRAARLGVRRGVRGVRCRTAENRATHSNWGIKPSPWAVGMARAFESGHTADSNRSEQPREAARSAQVCGGMGVRRDGCVAGWVRGWVEELRGWVGGGRAGWVVWLRDCCCGRRLLRHVAMPDQSSRLRVLTEQSDANLQQQGQRA